MFYRPDALSDAQPTVSKHRRQWGWISTSQQLPHISWVKFSVSICSWLISPWLSSLSCVWSQDSDRRGCDAGRYMDWYTTRWSCLWRWIRSCLTAVLSGSSWRSRSEFDAGRYNVTVDNRSICRWYLLVCLCVFFWCDAMLARYMSVCLSQVGVVLKWIKVRSRKQCHTIAQQL